MSERGPNNQISTLFTLIGGSLIMVGWTLIRFFTQPFKYDLVGQQLLSQQWLAGNVDGSVMAPTNYIIKMLTLYMPGSFLGIDPQFFLVASALFVNILTFVGIYFILKAILSYFNINIAGTFNLLLLWLATIAGSVFWLQFTNSRNLEIVAGLTVLYLGLLLYKKFTLKKVLLFIPLASLTFFADPMQLFVTATILGVYIILETLLWQKTKLKICLLIVATITISYLLSFLLTVVVRNVTHVEFFAVGTLTQGLNVFQHVPDTIIQTGENTFRLLAGTNEMGTWRQILNGLTIGVLVIVAFIGVLKNRMKVTVKRLTLFIAIGFIVPIAAYVASGQPLSGSDTSRYLVMLLPIIIMTISFIDSKKIPRLQKRGVFWAVVVLLTINIISLGGLALKNTHPILGNVAVLESRYSYLRDSKYGYAYGSMDTALPATYLFAHQGGKVILPLSCGEVGLRKAILFFDKKVFARTENETGEVPLILDQDSITNYPYVCNASQIKIQLGEPVGEDIYNGGKILIYKATVMKSLEFPAE